MNNRDYDLFEKLSDGSIVWRAVLSGYENAMAKLRELAAPSSNEFLLMDMPASTEIASMNGPARWPSAPESQLAAD